MHKGVRFNVAQQLLSVCSCLSLFLSHTSPLEWVDIIDTLKDKFFCPFVCNSFVLCRFGSVDLVLSLSIHDKFYT